MGRIIALIFMLGMLGAAPKAKTFNQDVTINYIEPQPKDNLNEISAVQLRKEIFGLGKIKCAYIIVERSKKDFESSRDFGYRMEGILSDSMIYRITQKYSFAGGLNDNKCGTEDNGRGNTNITDIQRGL